MGALCTGLRQDGTACGIVAATGEPPLCRHHRPKAERPADAAPVRSIRSPDDAMRLTAWAAIEVANGRMSQAGAHAVAAACREWRQNWDASAELARAQVWVNLAQAILRDETITDALFKSTDKHVVAARRALKR